MEQLQNTVDIVDKLTTAYYAALSIVFAIFLGVIIFLVYDKNSLKKEMRDKYNEILDSKVKDLQKEFNKGLNQIESKNNLRLFKLETLTYNYYVMDSLRNISTRSKKNLIWSIIHNSVVKNNNYLMKVKKNADITEDTKNQEAKNVYKNVSLILNECKKDSYFLFKEPTDKSLEYLKSINNKIENLNELISNLRISDEEVKIPIIEINKMIEKQKERRDSREVLKTIIRDGRIHEKSK